MRKLVLISASLILCTLLAAQTQTVPAAVPSAPSAPVSFDLSAMDRTVDPCQDFYQYACGGWRAAHPIPADMALYGRFDELREYNLYVLRSILEDAAKPGKRSALEKKVGDFYAACMDEKTVDAKGLDPIRPWFKQVDGISNKQQLLDLMAWMQASGLDTAFVFGSSINWHDSKMNIANIDQGGLTLADRDYYLKQDAKMVEVRARYLEHIQKMLILAGESPEQAKRDANTILALETKIADAYMDRVVRRDIKKLDNPMTVAELEKEAPQIDFPRYFKLAGAKPIESLNVSNPEFFAKFSGLLLSEPLESWKTYLRGLILNSSASLLSKPFVEENFAFSEKYLSGQRELEARWKRCTLLTDANLGDALGKLYVDKYFPKDAQKRMDTLVASIEQAMGADIRDLDWMSDETKQAAEEKLSKVTIKIGYPKKWKNYKSVKITRDELLSNYLEASVFEERRDLHKIGHKVDKNEWVMTPPTVEAYSSPDENTINFPAGILQPPFFSAKVDEAVNYGAIGMVIGHEVTHGFDDQGRKFDGDGNLRNWWTPKDAEEFEKRTACLVNQYSSFVSIKDDKGEVHLNGKLTLGENTADNGGMKLAQMAMLKQLSDRLDQKIEGFTPMQRLFIGFAQIWCENVTPQRARELALTDPHSPRKFRVIGVVQNSPEFSRAFGCKPGDPMVPANACRVW